MTNTSSYDIVDGNRVDDSTDNTTYVFSPTALLKSFTLAGNSDGDTIAIDAASSDFKVKFKKNEMILIGQKNTPSAGVIVKVQLDTTDGGVAHLAFLDGTVDASFVPNTPGALKGKWTFGGISGVKKVNLSAEGVSYEIDGSATYAQAETTANAILNSQTLTLTEDEDYIVLDTAETIDTVRGLVKQDGTSTFSLGDWIEGNGNTKVELTLDSTGEDFDADFVEMSGIDELVLKAGSSNGGVDFDASTYGTDISKVSLSGRDGMNIEVDGLQADSTLNVVLQTGGSLDVSGEWNGLNFDIELDNSDDSTNSSVNLTAATVMVVAGTDGTADLDLTLSSSGDGPVESVGSIVVGEVSLTAGVDGEVDFYVSGYANNTSAGDAIVGDVTVGNIGATLAKSATETDLTIEQSADADDGSATVGNMKVGNITLTAADYADFNDINLYQYAYADDGDATIGNRTVGNIDITLGANANGNNEVSLSQSASVSGSGDATIGNTVVGNIDVSAGDAANDLDVYVYAWADADVGNATIGNTQVGNVNMVVGDGDGSASDQYSFSAMATAQVADTGDASVGNMSIGNITQTAGNAALDGEDDPITNDNQLWAYAYQKADSHKGNATVGNLTVGNLTQTIGDDGKAEFTVSQEANANSGDATMGNVTVGNISQTGGARADLDGFVYQFGDVDGGDLVMGNLTVGNVDMTAGVDGGVYFSVEQIGSANSADDTITIGTTTVGNVDMTAGGGDGSAGFGLMATAYNDENGNRAATSVGNVMVGNVTIAVENSGSASFWNEIMAGAVGDVSYGDISIAAGENSIIDYLYIHVSAETADVGDVTVGDLSVNLGKDGVLDDTGEDSGIHVDAFENIGNVTLGNQTVTVATGADFGDDDAEVAFDFSAENGSIGTVKIGDISYTATGYDADIDTNTRLWAEDSIKSVTMGDISLSADGEDSDLDYELEIGTDGTIGDVKVGDLTAAAAGEDADADIDIELWAYNDLGDLTFGNVAITAENDHAPDVIHGGAEATVSISVSGTSDLGNVTVGSVTMSAIGEDADAEFDFKVGEYSHEIENIGDITFGDLNLMASGSSADVDFDVYVDSDTGVIGMVTLGNIDILVANTEEATEEARVSVTVDADGDLTVGDISLTQGDMTDWGGNYTTTSSGDISSRADMWAHVDLSAWNGDLVVGDITVTGGYVTTESGDTNDNYSYIGSQNNEWLELYAYNGTITVGDIDYSGYERAATIDVSDWLGAANIKASQGGSTIMDNDGQNTITLGDGADTVVLGNGNSGKATAADADVIIGFDSAEDVIDLDIAGSDFAIDSSGTTYANFLSAAEGANKDIYAAKVGSDYYVAIDTDNGDGVDFVIKLVGVSTVSSADFV